MGRLIVKLLVVVLMLKLVPEVPVEICIITLLLTAKVEVPEIEIPVPAVKREEMSEKLGAEDPLLLKSWEVVPTKVDLKVEPS